MDRPTNRMDADARTERIALPSVDLFLPPSRQLILDHCEQALVNGPILLTGDAGIGKTWTLNRLIRQCPSVRWVTIDLTPSDGPADFYRHLGRGLGLSGSNSLGPSRLDIADLLRDRSADEERFALSIDEAQNLSLAVWDEVRALLNQIGADHGFAHFVLVGQTALVRQFATRALAAIESRLATHFHLRPLDVAETRGWMRQCFPQLTLTDAEVEILHRDAGGNPSRLIRRTTALATRPIPRSVASHDTPAISPSLSSGIDLDDSRSNAMIAEPPVVKSPLVGRDRPPLHVEENSIEVGWAADDDDSSPLDQPEDASAANLGPPITRRAELSEQAVHDHYAALQAWREWARNQELQIKSVRSDRDLADEIDEAAAAEATESTEVVTRERTSIRSEGHQQFAPFGQLFNRMAPVREV